MKAVAQVLCVAAFAATAAADTNPIAKIIEMLSDQQAKIMADGEVAQKVYEEFAEFCDDRNKEVGYEIKTGKKQVNELEAAISKATSLIGSMTTKIEELSGSIAADEADLKAATEVRKAENTDFLKEEKELTEVIDMMERAISILTKEMQKGGASMLQLKSSGSITEALTMLVQASALSSAEGAKLAAFVQAGHASQAADQDADAGAPAAAAYEGQGADIIQTLEGLMEKAQTNLDEARKKENASQHNFDMLKQSLEDDIKYAQKDMDDAKSGRSAESEKKATAEGELVTVKKDLAADISTSEDLHQDCLTKAQDYEAEMKSRGEELEAINKAKKIIKETTGEAAEAQYGLSQTSLLQVRRSKITSGADLAQYEAVRFVRDLSRKQNAPLLAQLAARMAIAVRSGLSQRDVFAKVKGMISDMIAKLEKEAQATADKKAHCDRELSETNEKKETKTTELEQLATKIDDMTSHSAQLKEEVQELQKGLSEITAAQAEMNKLRKQENTDFVKAKADLEMGIDGVKRALKVLKDYYAQDKSHAAGEGAGAGIVSLLEVVESDLTKSLTETVSTEETAQRAYDAETQENEIDKVTKEKDVEGKTKQSKSLDKSVAEAKADSSSLQAELDSVLEYLASLKQECIAKPESYEERKERREAEIAGLKEAQSILEGGASLLQRGARRALRGPA